MPLEKALHSQRYLQRLYERLIFFGSTDRDAQAVSQGSGLIQILDQDTIGQ